MRNRFAAALVLIVAFASPVYAQTSGEITEQDVASALAARRGVSASLEEITARFEAAVASETLARERILELSRSVSRLEQEIGTKRSEVEALVVARYMAGGPLGTERVFTARTFTDLPVQARYYEVANERDLALLRGLESVEALHVAHRADLDQSLRAQEVLVEEIGGLTHEILTQLESADAAYNAMAVAFERQEEEKRLKAEEERLRREEAARRAAAAAARRATTTTTTTTVPTTIPTTTTTIPTTTTTMSSGDTTTTTVASTTTTTQAPLPPAITHDRACPVNAATSFSDTWGAPRSGGRSHRGVDMMAARNAPLVASESGVITRTSNSTLGGITIHLTGVSGSRYYYAHLEALAADISRGTSVTVGDVVGYNGSSGNSPNWLPHLHFEYAPPGGDWVNPYPLVKALCG